MKIIPEIEFKAANTLNAAAWTFRWLFLTFWTLEHLSFGADVSISIDRFGFGFSLLYLRCWVGCNGFCVPGWVYWYWEGLTSRNPDTRKNWRWYADQERDGEGE